MLKSLFSSLGLAMLLAMAASGCDRCDDPTNPECRNYDPCLVQGAVSAEFEMFENGFGWPEQLPVVGQINSCNTLVLTASQDLDSYEWLIGLEPTPRLGRTVTVTFECTPFNRIAIRLIVKGQPNLACDPNDDGIDTVIKYVAVRPSDSLMIGGRFRGRHTHIQEEDDFVVEIRMRPDRPYMAFPPPPSATWNYYIMNLPKGTPRPMWGGTTEEIYTIWSPLRLNPGGEGFWMPADENGWYSYAPEGYGAISADGDSLTIRYTILDSVQFWATPPAYSRNKQDTLTFIGIRQ